MTDRRTPHERPNDDRWDRGDEERIDKQTNVGWNPPTERERPPADDDDS